MGILEPDIVNMLHYYLNKNTDETNQKAVNPMVWSTLRRYIKTFLDTTWIYGKQLIIFRHSTLEQVTIAWIGLELCGVSTMPILSSEYANVFSKTMTRPRCVLCIVSWRISSFIIHH